MSASELEKVGYSLYGFWRLDGRFYDEYLLEAQAPDLAPHLPMDVIREALGGTEEDFRGRYLATVGSGTARFRFRYMFGKTIPLCSPKDDGKYVAHLWVEVSGHMSAPYPDGVPLDWTIKASLHIGDDERPIPMGKGQKRLAMALVSRALEKVTSFIAAFPEAGVYAFLESRGGRGGWRRKVARWHVGSANELAVVSRPLGGGGREDEEVSRV